MTNFDMNFKATKYIEEELDHINEMCIEINSFKEDACLLSTNCYRSLIDDAYSRIIGALHISRVLEVISQEEYNNYTKMAVNAHKKVVECIQENSNKFFHFD